MSGLGRRSHYRKHLTDSVLNDLPEPSAENNERVAKVVGTRGSNQFELVVGPPPQDKSESGSEEVLSLDLTPQLAILPTKYRKLVWLKRNDYVICSCAEDDGESGDQEDKSEINEKGDDGGIRYMIEHILYKDQVKHLKEKNLWPKHPFFSEDVNGNEANEDDNDGEDEEQYDDNDDGIVYDNADDDYFCNINRIAKIKVDDDSSSDEDSD